MFDSVIEDAEMLQRLATRLRDADCIGVDTEFKRERTYYPILCFLQVSTRDGVACIDPLAVTELEPVFEVLYDPAKVKILHSARQDLELFYRLRGALPQPLFDTQVAAAFCGYGDQIGYGPLVEKLLGVSLAKAHTRTDWCRRPLSDAQIRYAEDDVRYLPALRERLLDALGERKDWLVEDSGALLDPALYEVEPEQAWQRVGAGRELPAAAQVMLQVLAAWRERTAQQADLPRGWVVDDRGLCALAKNPPADLDQVRTVVPIIRKEILRHHGDALMDAIEHGRGQPPRALWGRAGRMDPPQRDAVRRVMQRLQERAEQQRISASLVATRRDLEQLVLGARDLPLLRGWRRQFIGDELLVMVEPERLGSGAG